MFEEAQKHYEPLAQKCCSMRFQEVWLWHRTFPAIFRTFPAFPPQFFTVGFDTPWPPPPPPPMPPHSYHCPPTINFPPQKQSSVPGHLIPWHQHFRLRVQPGDDGVLDPPRGAEGLWQLQCAVPLMFRSDRPSSRCWGFHSRSQAGLRAMGHCRMQRCRPCPAAASPSALIRVLLPIPSPEFSGHGSRA